MAKTYNKKVKPKAFNEGDLVLKKILIILGEDQNKWMSNYEGLYRCGEENLFQRRLDFDQDGRR
jgi:hypothetical protein